MTPFDRLHPAIQHHVVNTLGWRALRPLQEQAIEPILAGAHALLIGPTAGGKTEAATLPALSGMLEGRWLPLSVLYVCPLRALLNNLEPRLRHYASLVGRRAAMWHGDVGESARRAILSDPPDLLLTTPESIEVMLISGRVDHRTLFEHVRTVIIDEVHAFAGDDRGWHLQSVLARVEKIASRELQRIGLSATVGQPERLLEWLAPASASRREVVVTKGGHDDAQVEIDFVGSIENAGLVISRLHRGEKRLVFCDSRARVETLADEVRRQGVETFVSHSSLSAPERRRAEEAFASRDNCVIVATSTLELGIDVGDLDRVIQIDAPMTVASFLQRMGRTGRRSETRRNCLFLATTEDAVVQAAALGLLWREGFIEPIKPPARPVHLFAQQMMALSLQERGIGVNDWPRWIGSMPGFVSLPEGDTAQTLSFMLQRELMWDDNGILSMARQGEEQYGRRYFMDLMSAFISEPLFTVLHGREPIGRVHQASFLMRDDRAPVLLLAGRAWVVRDVDWTARVAVVDPTTLYGRSRWLGAGQPMSYALCQAIRRVLAEPSAVGDSLSARGRDVLTANVQEFPWIERDATAIVYDSTQDRMVWWTFGSVFANAALAWALKDEGLKMARPNNLAVVFAPGAGLAEVHSAVDRLRARVSKGDALFTPIADRAIEQLKFSDCLPREIAVQVLEARMTDTAAIQSVAAERVVAVAG